MPAVPPPSDVAAMIGETPARGPDAKRGAEARAVAVVIPCFGYAHLLGEAIESVLGQLSPPGDVLVVDDGSPDDTAAVAGRYAEQGVRYLRRPNGGPAAARNTGAQECAGEYVVFLDADDLLDPRYLARTCEAIGGAGPDVGYVYTQCRYFGARKGTSHFPDWDLDRLVRWNFVHASALIRLDLVRTHPFDEGLRLGIEDWDFYLSLAEDGVRGVLVDEPLLWYRKHDGGSRGDTLEHDRSAEREFRKVLRKHWRLHGVGGALRVEGYYLKRRLRRRRTSPPDQDAMREPG
jgi:glycosyltransferase involved in cell wall biosynthesis